MWPRLVAALSQYCGDVHLAEEVAQDALVRVCQRWRHVSQLASPEGWTYRVAVNLANSRWRRRRAAQRAHQRHGLDTESRPPVPVEDQLAVREALGRLTPKQRQAVVLRHVLELSVEEAAHVMDMTPGALRGLTHRAVGRLRHALDGVDLIGEEVSDVQ
jgi:RNA polymerase sigma factor (sigma-70 family)